MSKSSSPLKLGKETYGTLKINEAFLKAFMSYFSKDRKQDTAQN